MSMMIEAVVDTSRTNGSSSICYSPTLSNRNDDPTVPKESTTPSKRKIPTSSSLSTEPTTITSDGRFVDTLTSLGETPSKRGRRSIQTMGTSRNHSSSRSSTACDGDAATDGILIQKKATTRDTTTGHKKVLLAAIPRAPPVVITHSAANRNIPSTVLHIHQCRHGNSSTAVVVPTTKSDTLLNSILCPDTSMTTTSSTTAQLPRPPSSLHSTGGGVITTELVSNHHHHHKLSHSIATSLRMIQPDSSRVASKSIPKLSPRSTGLRVSYCDTVAGTQRRPLETIVSYDEQDSVPSLFDDGHDEDDSQHNDLVVLSDTLPFGVMSSDRNTSLMHDDGRTILKESFLFDVSKPKDEFVSVIGRQNVNDSDIVTGIDTVVDNHLQSFRTVPFITIFVALLMAMYFSTPMMILHEEDHNPINEMEHFPSHTMVQWHKVDADHKFDVMLPLTTISELESELMTSSS